MPDCWLLSPDGTRHPIDARGLLVGRGETAGILLQDPSASRRHALVYLDAAGPHLVPLGRVPVRVNGEPTHEPRPLADGDILAFPGCDLKVVRPAVTDGGRAGWVLKQLGASAPSGDLFQRLPETAFSMGGGAADAVRLAGWPEAAVRFEPAFPEGWKALLARGVTCNGRTWSPDRSVPICSGDRFGLNAQTVWVLNLSLTQRTTVGEEDRDLPVKVDLQPLPPAGGQVTVHTRAWTRTAFVPGLRYDLLSLLLQPPGHAAPGEGLTDGILAPRLWGRNLPADPKAVIVLVRRLRQDLDAAGMDGHALVIREHSQTWFTLMKGAGIEVGR